MVERTCVYVNGLMKEWKKTKKKIYIPIVRQINRSRIPHFSKFRHLSSSMTNLTSLQQGRAGRVMVVCLFSSF